MGEHLFFFRRERTGKGGEKGTLTQEKERDPTITQETGGGKGRRKGGREKKKEEVLTIYPC